MRPRLRVLLGGGGVGKTTLAAALALALARQGKSVGLLGIDPARRLRSALGLVELTDLPIEVPETAGRLRAAVLRPDQTLRRWAAESRASSGDAARLLDNPFFALLADGLATSTDALAAGRIVEWSEAEPQLDELIIDTAPGLPALEFLAKPDKILALLEGRLLAWLGGRGKLSGQGHKPWHIPRFASGLVRVAGLGAFVQIAEMIAQMEQCLATFGRRVGEARDWFRTGSTQLLVVASAERTGDCGQLATALQGLGLSSAAMVLNRALPPALLQGAPGDGIAPDERAFLAWLHRLARQQREALADLALLGAPVVTAPRASLDSRLGSLAQIGEVLLAQL